jgi:hypothetical protein
MRCCSKLRNLKHSRLSLGSSFLGTRRRALVVGYVELYLIRSAELITLLLKVTDPAGYHTTVFETTLAADRHIGWVFRPYNSESGLLTAITCLADGRLFIMRKI